MTKSSRFVTSIPMKLSTYLLLLVFISFHSEASFKELSRDFIGNSADAQTSLLDAELAALNNSMLRAQNSLYLAGSLSYANGANPSLFSFQSQETTNYLGNYQLSKKFSWGGKLSFSQGLNLQDISRWNNIGFALPSNATKYYTFQNQLTYEQDLISDFAGRNFKLSLSESSLSSEIAHLNKSQISNKKLYELFLLYNQTKLLMNIHDLNKKNLLNAKKRNSVVKSRFSDGISSVSEKLQASQSLEMANNSLVQSEQAIEQALNRMSSFMGRQVVEVDVNKKTNSMNEVNLESVRSKENLDLAILEKSLELSKLTSQRVSNSSGLGLNLKLSYSRSAISDDITESLRESFSNNNFDNKEASLNFNYAFGKDPSQIDELKKKIEVQKNITRFEQLKKQLESEKTFLRSSISKNKQQLNNLKRMQSLSYRIVKEQDKLYKRGKIEIENVLSAQTESINISRQILEKRASLNADIANFFQLNGNFTQFLEMYNE